MRTPAVILYGEASQEVWLRLSRRPTAASYAVHSVYDGDDQTAEMSGSATIDTVDTTTDDAISAASRDIIPLTSVAGIVAGRQYRLSDDSVVHWVDVVQVDSANGQVRAREPVPHLFSAGAVFESTLVSFAVDDSWAADDENLGRDARTDPRWRVRWEVTLAGETEVQYTYFDVQRARVPTHVTWNDVIMRAPHVDLPRDSRFDAGAGVLASSWEMLRSDLESSGVRLDAIAAPHTLDEAHILATLLLLAEDGRRPAEFSPVEYVELRRAAYERHVQNHLTTTKKHRSFGADGDVVTARAASIWES